MVTSERPASELSAVEREGRAGRVARRSRRRAADDSIDYGPLARWIGFHLRLAQNASFQAFAREARGIELRPGRFAVLMLIGRNPGISQTTLSRANGRDKSTLTPLLEDLERRRVIRRVRADDDRRSYRLSLTAAGEVLLARLTERAARHDRRLDRIVGPRDRAKFLRNLKRIAAELNGGGTANGMLR
jgi:DNA-binding MarR family transcriptional regulator